VAELTQRDPENREVDEFILGQIDSVPHLEALLLVWNSRPTTWSVEELAQRLYVKREIAGRLLDDLARARLIGAVPGKPETYAYPPPSDERDRLIGLVDAAYRHEIVRVSTMIHSKASSAVRDFARAFRFTKERE